MSEVQDNNENGPDKDLLIADLMDLLGQKTGEIRRLKRQVADLEEAYDSVVDSYQ